MGWLDSCFEGLVDSRNGNARRYKLLDVLMIALTAMICGAETCVDFADFARDRACLFGEFLTLESRLPSRDTFSRLFRPLDPAGSGRCFGRFPTRLGEAGAGVLAIGCKTPRRSFDTAASQSPLHVVCAFASKRRLVLAQAAVRGKQDEIIAARAMLEMFDIKDMLVAADTLHGNAGTRRLVVEREADSLMSLKGNRPSMFAEVRCFFAQPPACLANTPPSMPITAVSKPGATSLPMMWSGWSRSIVEQARPCSPAWPCSA